MEERTTYITIDSNARDERPIFTNFLNSMERLGRYGVTEAFVFHRHYDGSRKNLETDYIIDTGTSLRIQGRISPIEEVPNHSQIYAGKIYDSDKIAAILNTAPVGIIAPSRRHARLLERTIEDLGYQYLRV